MIHGHGNATHLYPNLVADFSTNVWYKGVSKQLEQTLCCHISKINNYPEPDAGSLKSKIGEHYQVDDNCVLVTNGSTEAFYLIAQRYLQSHSVILSPGFSEYSDACTLNHHSIEYLSNTSDWQNRVFEDKLVWLANPNNPDGKLLTVSEIEWVLKCCPSSIFIIDEAYVDLCYGAQSAIPLLKKYSNLIVIKSVTKTFSIPGLRLGYLLSSPEIIKSISAYLLPWSVNSLAIVAGKFLLENFDELAPNKTQLYNESCWLQSELSKNSNLKVTASSCNFFLVESLGKSASHLKDYLITNYGMLIRDASNFKGLNQFHFRIGILAPHLNVQLVDAIAKWSGE